MCVFVGLIYAPDEEQRILEKSKVGLQSSANNYQWGLIRGLFETNGEKVKVYNSVPMGSFPRYCKLLIEKKRDVQTEEAQIYSLGCLNLPVIKQWQRKQYIYKSLKQLSKKSVESFDVVVYSLYSPYIKALKKLKRKYKNINYILVVPDLPGNFGLNSGSWFRQLYSKLTSKTLLKNAKYADGFVLLTEQMKSVLKIDKKPYIIIEGMCNNPPEIQEIFDRVKPQIIYTGAIEEKLGIPELVKAFEMLPCDSSELLFAGEGSYLPEILKKCKKNQNIRYLGYLTKEKVNEFQRRATILVNPRSAEEEFTKYSFPSKTIEYLATGVPVVMNRLPGIPSEYAEHIYYTENSSAEALAQKFQQIFDMDVSERREHGQRSSVFVREKKNSLAQAKKLVALISELKK